jgi:hypothetical protein
LLRPAGALAGVSALLWILPAQASATPEEVRQELRGAEAPVDSLALSDRVPLAGGSTVYRYDQERAGIPVHGSEAIVLDRAGDGADLVNDGTEPGIGAPPEPALSASRAIAIATDSVGAKQVVARPDAELVIDPAGDGRLAWKVTVLSDRPLGDFEVLVDALTGEVISERDLTWRATGFAKLYRPNPVVEQGSYVGLRDRGDRDRANLTALRSSVELHGLLGGQSCLRGEHANIRVGQRAKRVCKKRASSPLNWNGVKRESDKFEALMAYLHVHEAQVYLETLDIGNTSIEDGAQRVIANALSADQSFYSPSRDAISLGAGGVDDGEDGDVIVHEYGHAVHDAEAGAFGEGWGDYFAETMSAARWENSGPDPGCVMEWDAVSYDTDTNNPLHPSDQGICLRRTDNPNTLSEQQTFCGTALGGGRPNEIHCVGEVWSSALWDLRAQLGIDTSTNPDTPVLDRALVASQAMYATDESFAEAAEALVLADDAIYEANDHCTEIRAEMVAREFLDGFTCP